MIRLVTCAVALLLAAVSAVDDEDVQHGSAHRTPLTVCTAERGDLDAECSANFESPENTPQCRSACGYGAKVWRKVALDLGLEEGVDFTWTSFPGPDGFADMLADVAGNGSSACDIAAAAVANTAERASSGVSFSSPFLENQRLGVMVADLDPDVALHVARSYPGHRLKYLTALGTPVATGMFFGSIVAVCCTWSILSCCYVRPEVQLVPVSLAAMFIGPAVGVWITHNWTAARLAAVMNPVGVFRLPDLATTDARDAGDIGGKVLEVCTVPTYVQQLEKPDLTEQDHYDYDGDELPTDCPYDYRVGFWGWFWSYKDDGHMIATARHGWDYDAMLASFVAPLEALADGVQAPVECRAIAADLPTLASLARRYDEAWAQRYNGTSRRKPVHFRILHGHCTYLLGKLDMSFAVDSGRVDTRLQLGINKTIQTMTDEGAVACSADLHSGSGLLRDGDENLYDPPGIADLIVAVLMFCMFVAMFFVFMYLFLALVLRPFHGSRDSDVLLQE